jgi:hypothetical protein
MINYTVRDASDILGPAIIRNNEDGTLSTIPIDLGNSDYQAYLRWLENPEAEENGTIS